MKIRFIINMALAGTVSVFAFTGCATNADENYRNGMECFNEADYDGAAGFFKEAVDKDSDNTKYLISLGMAQTELMEYDEAIKTFDSAISADSECADAYRGKGIVYYRQGDYANAITELESAVSKSGKGYDEIKIDSLKYCAACQYITGDYEAAVDLYGELIDHADKDDMAELYYARGTAYIKLDDENSAVLDYEKSLDFEDDNYETYCNMYSNFKEAGYVDRAESYLRRLLNGEETDAVLFGKTYYNLGDYDRAVECLEGEYNDGNSDAAYYLAMTYEAMGNYAEAESLYQEYLGKHPNDAYIYNQYGAYLINRGKYNNALVYIETGIELNDSGAMQGLLYNQAVCYEYCHEFDKAMQAFEDYLVKYPGDKLARKEYEFLKTR